MKNNRLNFIIVLLLAAFIGVSWGVNQQIGTGRHPDFTSFSRADRGTALLYDTLRHMQFPVGILYRSVTDNVSINNAVFIIQPTNPRISEPLAREILEWVQRGGRLVYLENGRENIMDRILLGSYYTSFGSKRLYRVGLGQIIAGRANPVINMNLMEDPAYGEGLVYILYEWAPDRIYFAEYYHGFHRTQTTFSTLPVWIQLIVFQIFIGTVTVFWHFGKRFGRPIPYYEAVERGENEQVFALARLYKQADER